MSRYDFTSRSLYVGVHDKKAPENKLLILYLQDLFSLEEAAVTHLFALLTPWTITHEYAHHLRHAVGVTGPSPWAEEQAAHLLPAAWPHCMSEGHRAQADALLTQALAGLSRHTQLAPDSHILTCHPALALSPAVTESPARRQLIINHFNTYGSSPSGATLADYLFLQLGWTLLALRSPCPFPLTQWLREYLGNS
ncbi:hypothetical protein K4749_40425 [Streptomyces sp. TRM72054]|uniref:hypothetical protein n=1 Tax=Streptomyces sp. TRM72054 TaxID=2870562 RepID=UPI001C8C7750|nr:hypothetical protein [Streptomyces sp. TRM72054]MBX9399608.1 hypothetical protein [Streptomyces sp. TRM72054]